MRKDPKRSTADSIMTTINNTKDCVNLRDEIEAFIRQGRLRRFIAGRPRTPPEAVEEQSSRKNLKSKQLQEIKVIVGGSVGGGVSTSARKAHIRAIRAS